MEQTEEQKEGDDVNDNNIEEGDDEYVLISTIIDIKGIPYNGNEVKEVIIRDGVRGSQEQVGVGELRAGGGRG